MLAAEGCGLVKVNRANGLANPPLNIGLGQVGGNLAGAFTSLQLLGKELLRGLERFALFGLLLVGDKVQIVVGLFLYLLALEGRADLPDKQVARTTVKHQVV